MRLVVFDLLGDQANLGARVALVVKAVDDLTVEKLSNRLDVFLHALVGHRSHSACNLSNLANLVEVAFRLVGHLPRSLQFVFIG